MISGFCLFAALTVIGLETKGAVVIAGFFFVLRLFAYKLTHSFLSITGCNLEMKKKREIHLCFWEVESGLMLAVIICVFVIKWQSFKVKRNLSLVSCNRDVYPEMLKESVCCSVGCQGFLSDSRIWIPV
ncbi:uncharacterized protein LOC113293683 [Papaver somniferum]|uniref:uncharacterized protein LOC113293683 n=1 Tax=Papaver somniferum TaxID=3469 RepID=UPI000E6F4884|nr:uncharacterized protein LOC113293683 [Papaver somniferum]